MTPNDIQRTFRVLPGLFLVIRPDADFTIIGASDDYMRATHTSTAMFGKPLFEVFPDNPADAGATGVTHLKISLARVLETREPDAMPPQRYDVRLAGTDTFEERYWSAVNVPVLDADGNVDYIVQRVDEATARSNRDAVAILESITEGFFTLDRQWRFDYVNREAHRILDKQPGELTGKVLWEAYPGLEGTEFGHYYHHTMRTREKSSFTAFYPAQQRWYEVTAFPAPEGISVYFRNVTGQKDVQAERERLVGESETQRRMYQTVLNSTPDLVYVFDLAHSFIYANEALTSMWGVTDYHGKKLRELGYEEWHAAMHDSEIRQVVATREPIRGEVPFTGTNGTRVYDYIFTPVLGPQGDVVAVAGTTRDITERQASEQAIREQAGRLADSDRAKDDFLATLSHELRNPLAPLRNSLALLRRGEAGKDSQAAGVHAVMERQVDHMVRLVDDLLEVSRISRGSLSLQKEKVELAAIVRNALETAGPLIEAAGHVLAVELPSEPLWLEGDPVRLSQTLANLLNNAANYTDAGGKISVRAQRDGDHVAVTVRDTGIGLAPDVLPRMFEMFTRGDRDKGRHQGGLGIGLALSRRLTQMHGGTLEAHSEGTGKGSEFTLRLPLAPPPEAAGPQPAAGDVHLGQSRVLVVDDNHDSGDTLAMILEMLGAEVRVVRDGLQALEAYPGYRPSVVLLDIGMPGMNGYEVARAMRSQFPDVTAKLVALTGWGQEDDRRRAREAGFDHHLVKPVEIDTLQQLLSSLEG